jgi:hypothetical protein
VLLSALGAVFVAAASDWVLGWAPHNPAVRVVPGYYWAFPALRLVVLLAAGAVLFRSHAVAEFWADQRGRRVAALSPFAWIGLAVGLLGFVAWRVAVTSIAEPSAAADRGRMFAVRG